MKSLLAAVGISAVMAFLIIYGVAHADTGAVVAQQPTVNGQAVDQLVGFVCADNGTVLKWLLGILGVPTLMSILGNWRSKMPPALQTLVEGLSGDLVKAAAAWAEHKAAQTPKAG